MHVEIDVETTSWNVGGQSDDDPWSRDSYDGHITNVVARATDKAVSKSSYGSYIKDLDVKPGDMVYAVVVGYDSYDTFGRDGGQSQVMGVFAEKERAEALYKLCQEIKEYDESRWNSKPKVAPLDTFEGESFYVAWTGWGSSVDTIDVWELRVGGGDSRSHGVSYRQGR